MDIGNAEMTLKKTPMANFIEAFQRYFSQSLHLAFLLRYAASAQRAARDQPRDHIRN
jgi:heme A synthase